MKTIPLTMNKNAIVDDEDFERVAQIRWYSAKRGSNFYGVHTKKIEGKRCSILLHRFIMNTQKGVEIDHINGNTLDNRKSNLRICSHSENMKNMKCHKDNQSGHKGVSWHTQDKKWRARIHVDGKTIDLGLFNTIDRASKAYNDAAMKYHGKFAKLNKVV